MKLKQLWIIGIINLVFVIAGLIMSMAVIDSGDQYNKEMYRHVETLTFKDRLLNQDEWVMLITGKVISSIEDEVWEKKKLISEEALNKAEGHYIDAESRTMSIIYSMIGLLFVTVLFYAGGNKLWLALGASLGSISLVLLYLGVYFPMIEIHAYEEDLEIPIVIKFDEMAAWADEYVHDGTDYLESISEYFGYKVDLPKYSPMSFLVDGYQYDHSVTFEGKMYYFFQSKSVDNIIDLLKKDKNFSVAYAILAFSIIIPLIKLLLTVMIIFVQPLRSNKLFQGLLYFIGKWSMADIFVAGAFLAYFSISNMNQGVETESKALIGLQFFLGYAIISILASVMIWINTRQETKLANNNT